MKGRPQEYSLFGRKPVRDELAETIYLLEPIDSGSYVPVRIEVTVVTRLMRSKLMPGHTHRECATHHQAVSYRRLGNRYTHTQLNASEYMSTLFFQNYGSRVSDSLSCGQLSLVGRTSFWIR
jgi:hypothetical protein